MSDASNNISAIEKIREILPDIPEEIALNLLAAQKAVSRGSGLAVLFSIREKLIQALKDIHLNTDGMCAEQAAYEMRLLANSAVMDAFPQNHEIFGEVFRAQFINEK